VAGKRRQSVAEPFQNVPGKEFLDLTMTRYRLALLGAGILIPIVLPTVADEQTTHRG